MYYSYKLNISISIHYSYILNISISKYYSYILNIYIYIYILYLDTKYIYIYLYYSYIKYSFSPAASCTVAPSLPTDWARRPNDGPGLHQASLRHGRRHVLPGSEKMAQRGMGVCSILGTLTGC